MGLVAGQKEGYLQLYPLQAAVMAVGPLVLFPGLIVESWQGVSIEPLKLAPNWGSIKQCPPGSLVGCPGPWRRTKVEPNVGSWPLLRWRLFLSRAAASMHLQRLSPPEKKQGWGVQGDIKGEYFPATV